MLSSEISPTAPGKKIINVEFIGQDPYYPCGCEGISAVMLLNYHGFKITPEYFFSSLLDTYPFSYDYRTDTYYGEDMDRFYVGDPRSDLGKGCYAPVIKSAIEKAVPENYIAVVEQGGTLESLVDKYIKDLNTPVLIWATSYMRDSFKGTEWLIKRTGEACYFPAYMHCLVLVGYDDDKNIYYFNDPYDNRGLVAYNKDLVEEKFEELGSQALALVTKEKYKSDETIIDTDTTYMIRNAASGKYLTVADCAYDGYNNVYQHSLEKGKQQLFKLKKNADGSFCIISESGSYTLDISLQNVIANKKETGKSQSFDIKTNENGFLSITISNAPDHAVSALGNYNGNSTDTASGNISICKTKDEDFYQQWQLIPVQ